MAEDLMSTETGRKVANWERHIQSGLLAAVMLFVGWMANFLWDAKGKSAETATQIGFMTQQIVELKNSTTRDIGELKGLVTAMQANYVGRDDFRDHEIRLRSLENNGHRLK